MIRGGANKGPFSSGSDVTLWLLDSTGAAGDVLEAADVVALGEFEIAARTDSAVLLEVEGRYFSEVRAEFSDEVVVLSGVRPPGETAGVSINVLTALIVDRVRVLMSDGLDASVSVASAERELMLALGTIVRRPDGVISFNSVVILNGTFSAGDGEGNAYLLAISSLVDCLAFDRSESVGAVLTRLAADFADDGSLSPGDDLMGLETARGRLNPDQIHGALVRFDSLYLGERLEASLAVAGDDPAAAVRDFCVARQSELVCGVTLLDASVGDDDQVRVPLTSVVANLNLCIDTDGDGEVNATDPDDDNDGIQDDMDMSPYGGEE